MGGNDAGSQSLANTLNSRAASFQAAESNSDSGISFFKWQNQLYSNLNNLATRLKEIGVADTLSTNTTSDTAALNSEAVYVSDTIDSIVSSLTFNGINILATSSKTFAIGINDAG